MTEQTNNSQLNTIEEAIEDIKAGKIIIVVDDEDRENEGDFVTAARNVTPEIINFMATHGRGLICAPIVESIAHRLGLELMVGENNSLHDTPFTISIDLNGHGCSTGISAADRSKTVMAMIDPEIKGEDFAKPGHIFPLKARKGGVLRRAGHTEATIDLARLAGFEPAGVIVEIMNEDGTMARLPEVLEIAKRFDMKIISIEDLIKYRMSSERLIEKIVDNVAMPTKYGDFKIHGFRQLTTGDEHFALTKGEWNEGEPVLVRVHSSCLTGDLLGSMRCDCGEQLNTAMQMVEKEGKGAILYMNQEGRGIGLLNKLKAYKLQEQGMNTYEANKALGFKMDERDYGVGAQILRDLNITKLRLISNNPKKRTGIIGYGLEIVENVAIEMEPNEHNESYLKAKRDIAGHEIMGDRP